MRAQRRTQNKGEGLKAHSKGVEGSKAHSKGGRVIKRTTQGMRAQRRTQNGGEGSKAHSKGRRGLKGALKMEVRA